MICPQCHAENTDDLRYSSNGSASLTGDEEAATIQATRTCCGD